MDRYATLRNGLVGAWCPSLGATGYTLIDRSGRNNHGVLTNMGGQTNWRASGGGLALNLDGTNDFVDLAPLLSGRGVVTVTFWARPTNTSSRCEVNEGTDNTTRSSYALAEDGNAYILPGSLSGFGRANWSALGVSAFIHFAGVFDIGGATDADRARLWLNGVQRTLTFTGTIPTTAPTFTGRLRIGVRPDNLSYSAGLIDDIRIYNRALTASEIRLLASQRGIGLLPTRHRRGSLLSQFWLNVAGTWKTAKPWINVGGTWRQGSPKIRAGGAWKG